MFENRTVVIATKHEKEAAIAPILEQSLGVKCVVLENFDTDVLGTFSGEVERTLDPIAAAREKCKRAMELSGCDMAIASEGSFGPHPSMFFVSADDEFLMLVDQKNELEIVVRELSTETNFNGKEIRSEHELKDFAKSAQFPSHGLILRKSKTDTSAMFKGIVNQDDLLKAYEKLLEISSTVYAETDMRALYNPSRMQVIAAATKKLVEKVKSTCPNCHKPGFGVTEAKSGLPCGLCGMPTKSTLSYVSVCQYCKHTEQSFYPHKKETEDPMYCDFCNP